MLPHPLDDDDLMAGVVVVLVVLVVLGDLIRRETRASHRAHEREQRHVAMGEAAARHLEQGGEIRIPRWHGNPMVLQADVILDADQHPSPPESTDDDA